jgi:hypothetical protein
MKCTSTICTTHLGNEATQEEKETRDYHGNAKQKNIKMFGIS